MIKTSKDNYTQPQSILLLGQPGTGKSTLLCQFEDLFVLDCDNNLAGPMRYLEKENKLGNFYYGSPYLDDEGKPLNRRDWYDRAIQLLLEADKEPKVKGFAIDSLTSFSEIIMTKVLLLNNKTLGDFELGSKKPIDDKFTYDEWGALFNLMKQLIFRLKSTNKLVIFVGHIRTKEDELSKVLRQYVAFPGQTSEIMASFFSEVWLMESRLSLVGNKKVEERVIRTFPQVEAQCSLGLKSPSGIVSGSVHTDATELIRLLNK